MYRILIRVFTIFLKTIQTLFKSKSDLLLESLALRQQLAKYLTKNIKPKLTDVDRFFWVGLRQVWGKWANSLIIVKPETVIDWQNRRFKRHWTKISNKNKRPGRKRIKKEIRDLIILIRMEESRLVQLFPAGSFVQRLCHTGDSYAPNLKLWLFSSRFSRNILQKVPIPFFISNLVAEKCLLFRPDGILRTHNSNKSIEYVSHTLKYNFKEEIYQNIMTSSTENDIH